MKKLKDMTKKELKDEYISICQMIDNSSFGVRDLLWRNTLEKEIEKRGMEIYTKVVVR